MQLKSPKGASVALCSRPTAALNRLFEPVENIQNVMTTHLACLPKGMVDTSETLRFDPSVDYCVSIFDLYV